MNEISIFPDKEIKPTDNDLVEKLNKTYKLWTRIYDMVFEKYPNGLAEWNYPCKKYGWSFRNKDKRRAIIYFIPREKYFNLPFVFGDNVVAKIM